MVKKGMWPLFCAFCSASNQWFITDENEEIRFLANGQDKLFILVGSHNLVPIQSAPSYLHPAFWTRGSPWQQYAQQLQWSLQEVNHLQRNTYHKQLPPRRMQSVPCRQYINNCSILNYSIYSIFDTHPQKCITSVWASTLCWWGEVTWILLWVDLKKGWI